MKIDPAFVQALVALAALLAGLYGVVTRPLLKRMDDIRADIVLIQTDLRGIHAELKTLGERLTRVEERLPPPMVHR
jgi:hypothetical protein